MVDDGAEGVPIPGFFVDADRLVFRELLRSQEALPQGDLLEIGAFLGKSAVVIGESLRDGEQFYVVDPFEDEGTISDSTSREGNIAENRRLYPMLRRSRFEYYYSTRHKRMPSILQMSSSGLDTVLPHNKFRFIHVDGSHIYDQARQDTKVARTLLQQDGLVVLDDFRTEHTPGVAAATWEAIILDGLVPIAFTQMKCYATFGSPSRYTEALMRSDRLRETLEFETVRVRNHDIIRFSTGISAPICSREKWLRCPG